MKKAHLNDELEHIGRPGLTGSQKLGRVPIPEYG